MKKTLKTLACSAVAALVGASAFAAAGWLGAGAIYIGEKAGEGCTGWYYADQHSSTTWCDAGPFGGADLGELTSLTLGGQVQLWDANSADWGWGSTAKMYYSIDGGAAQLITLNYYKFQDNNNFFQAGGDPMVPVEVSLADLDPGAHTLAIYFDDYDSLKTTPTYTANFTIPQYQTVTFDVNGEGAICTTNLLVFEIGGIYEGFEKPVWENHKFFGWFTEREGGTRVLQGREVTGGSTLTLYAHWEPSQTVNLDVNGGPSPKDPIVCVRGGYYIGLTKPTWDDNHEFKGWYSEPAGGTRVSASTPVTDDLERTLYAHWKVLRQTVTFDPNGEGASCSKQSVTLSTDKTYGGFPKPVWEGHDFLGWFDDPVAGERVKSGMAVTDAAERPLYAHWKSWQTVIFDPNGDGATCSKASVACVIGGTYSGFPKPVWGANTFRGWYDDPTAGKRVRAGDDVTDAAERTLYAHWKEGAAPLAISGFSFASKTARATRRGTTTDTLDRELTGQTSTSYNNWSGKTSQSDAVYAGNSAGGNSSIQLRSNNNNSGIVTTSSGGKARKVTLDWNDNTSSTQERIVQVYGKNSEYSQATDLYSSTASVQGDLLGEMKYQTDTGTELSITDDYQFIGLRSKNGALYLNSVQITWETSSDTPTVAVQADQETIEEGESVEITASASGFSDNDSVQWVWFVGDTQQAETGDTLVLDDLTPGEYRVTACGYLGDDYDTATESDSDMVTITVNPASVWYTITVDDQIENGTIEADMDVAQDGDTVTLTAHPDSGYALEKFYVDGLEIQGNTFQIQGADVFVSATFVVKTSYTAIYTVTSKTAVSATGDVPDGSSATYSQTYNSTAGQATKTNSLSLVLKGYEGLKIVGLTLSMHSNGSSGAGTLSVTSGTNTIASIANAGFGDDSWHGSYVNTWVDVTPAVTQTVVDDDVIFLITASTNSLFCQSYSVEYEFVPVEPSVTLSPSGALEVYVDDEVTITATPHDFSGEVEWTWYVDNAAVAGATTATFSLDTSVDGTYAVTAMANYGDDEMAESDPLTVTVKAPATAHDIEIETDGNGTVTADPNPAMEGQTVTLTVVANEGYRLDEILSDDVAIANLSFVMPDDDVYLLASFEGKHDVVIDDQIVNGTVEASPATAFSEETVTLTVQPDEGYELGTLTVLDEDMNEIPVTDMSFAMPKGDAYVFATFAEIVPHDVVIFTNGVGTVEADVYSAYEGETVTLTVTPGAGYKLGSIEVDEVPLSGLSFVMPDDDVAVEVTFVEKGPEFVKVTSMDEFKAGADYLIVAYKADNFTSALKNEATGNRIALDEVEIVDDIVETDSAALVWTISASTVEDGKYTLYNAAAEVYAAAPIASSANQARLLTDGEDEYAQWTISIADTNDPVVTIGSLHSGRALQRNSTAANAYFANYQSGTKPYLFKKVEETQYQTVTFDVNGEGAICTTNLLVFEIGGIYEGFEKPVWENHKFFGWFTEREGGTRVLQGREVTGGSELTLYAHWEPSQTVYLDANGCPWTKDPIVCVRGGVYEGLTKPTWDDNHEFKGWYDDPTGGNRVKSGSPVTDDLERTLYAHWKVLRQTVTFDPNGEGASCSKQSVTLSTDKTYGGFPKPVWEGHDFLGWFDDPVAGERVKSGMAVTDAAERPLYAHWKSWQTVIFDPNGDGATCSKASVACVIGGTYSGFPKPVWGANTFRGWYDDPTAGKRVRAGDDVTDAAERTLYAHWKEGAAPLAISAFTMSPRAVPAARSASAQDATVAFTFRLETLADVDYVVQWTSSLDGDWTDLKRWTANVDGMSSVTVDVPAGFSTGFFRIGIVDDE